MKKCKFCNHRAFTDRGEEVCAKYLLYIGDDKEEHPCNGFETTISWKPIAFLAACLLCVILIVSML